MLSFAFEYPRRLRAGFIGCGDHAYRNVYPALRYAPVDLLAVCDRREERAQAFARQFGAHRAYTDAQEMLEKEDLEVVFIVTGYGPDRRPNYPPLAMAAMRSGAHAWIEKPPASSCEEIQAMQAVETETGRFTMVGFKKCFFPANRKAKVIMAQPEFGTVRNIYARYPQGLPTQEKKGDPGAMIGFLDHLCHPGSLLQYLAGPVEELVYFREPFGGGVTASLRFRSGAVGSLHLVSGISGTSPLERVEVVGSGANVIVENGVKLTYYRPGGRGEGGYGRSPSFIGPDEGAPLAWEPEFSLGQLYNSGLFLLGYAPEILEFCRCVLEGTRPDAAHLEDALEVTRLYEAFLQPEGQVIRLNEIGPPR